MSELKVEIKNAVLGTRILYPQKDAAYILGVSLRTIGYLISEKKLMTKRIGKRQLIPLSELQRFAKSDHPIIASTRRAARRRGQMG